jgi:glycosyltransferase involved in cell wall biosynthesis
MAHREKKLLERALRSLAFADEVIAVVDPTGDPETEAVARASGARVVLHRYEGDIEQKRFAVAQATHDWVLYIDADEEVTPELAQEVREHLERGETDVVGFEISRRTWHLGRWIRHGDFNPDRLIRCFRRGKTRVTGANPHGRFVVDGRVEPLSEVIAHYSYRDLADQVERIQSFSDISHRALASTGREVTLSDLTLRPFARFLRGYVLKQGFRDGVPGFVIAVASAFHVFLKYAKLWEKRLPEDRRAPPL